MGNNKQYDESLISYSILTLQKADETLLEFNQLFDFNVVKMLIAITKENL